MLLRTLIFFLPPMAFAGQSLVLNNATNISVADPVLHPNQSWRIEFQLHNWTVPPDQISHQLYYLSGTGSIARLFPNAEVEIETLDPVTQRQPCFVVTKGRTNALVRVQKNARAMLFSCEIWNFDGTGYASQVLNISQLAPHPTAGGSIGSGSSAALGFLRIATTLLPLGAKPPTTADGGDWTELKFDGNLKDSSGHNHNASGSGFAYMATPNQVAVANPKTAGAPAWSNWVSLRAGYPARLDGSASYSLADASSAVTCVWQQKDGPSTVIWTDRNTLSPTLNGLIFGTYDFSLQVTDAAGNTAAANLQVGAVATDDNGVVVNADPNVDKIFGPMIAFGKNPWGYADERAMAATRLRMAAYNAQGYNPPSFATPGRGTVTYIFNGVGAGGRARRKAIQRHRQPLRHRYFSRRRVTARSIQPADKNSAGGGSAGRGANLPCLGDQRTSHANRLLRRPRPGQPERHYVPDRCTRVARRNPGRPDESDGVGNRFPFQTLPRRARIDRQGGLYRPVPSRSPPAQPWRPAPAPPGISRTTYWPVTWFEYRQPTAALRSFFPPTSRRSRTRPTSHSPAPIRAMPTAAPSPTPSSVRTSFK